MAPRLEDTLECADSIRALVRDILRQEREGARKRRGARTAKTLLAALSLFAPATVAPAQIRPKAPAKRPTAAPKAMKGGLGDVRRGKSKVERELKENRAIAAEADEQLGRVETRVKSVTERLDATRERLDAEMVRKRSLAVQTDAALSRVEARKAVIRRRLRAIYILGEPRPEMALLRASSVGDLSARSFLASRLAARDRAMYEDLRAATRRLRTLRDASARSVGVLKGLTAEQGRRQRELNGAKRAKEELLARLKDRRGGLVAAITQFDADENRIAHEIAVYEARARAAEAQRQRNYAVALARYEAAVAARRREIARRAAEDAREKARITRETRARKTVSPVKRKMRPALETLPKRPEIVTKTRTSGGWRRPASGPITSGFGMRLHPILKVVRMHWGVDFGGGFGAPVFAARGGTVIAADTLGGYGRTVIVDHGGGLTTVYGHLSSFAVSAGTRVSAGQRLGAVGSSGLSTGPHLHFEVHLGPRRVDPMSYLR